jgi:hypothetical protein
VDKQCHFDVNLAESGESRKRDGHEIANAGNIEDYLVGTFFEEPAAQQSNHRVPVLPGRVGSVNEAGSKRVLG